MPFKNDKARRAAFYNMSKKGANAANSDLSKTAKIVYPQTEEGMKEWSKDTRRSDLQGVDTKIESGKHINKITTNGKLGQTSEETKKIMELEKIKSLGSEWEKGEMHRIYINDLHELYGLDLNYFGTGNISSAKLDGEKISNTKARKITTDLDFAKYWYDVKTGEFHSKGLSDNAKERIENGIKTKLGE